MTEPEVLSRALDHLSLPLGARVLDVGCGFGDVSAAVAGRVGDEGQVVGLDRDPSALAVARERAAARGQAQVEFLLGELDAPPCSGMDAVVGRRVLMYQRDPVVTLRRLAGVVRSGGRVLFVEHDASVLLHVSPAWGVHGRYLDLVWRTVAAEGGHLDMGLGLYRAMVSAGLRDVRVGAEALLQLPGEAGKLPMVIRYMVPRMLAAGVVEALDPDAVESALAEERERADGPLMTDLVFFAWGRVG